MATSTSKKRQTPPTTATPADTFMRKIANVDTSEERYDKIKKGEEKVKWYDHTKTGLDAFVESVYGPVKMKAVMAVDCGPFWLSAIDPDLFTDLEFTEMVEFFMQPLLCDINGVPKMVELCTNFCDTLLALEVHPLNDMLPDISSERYERLFSGEEPVDWYYPNNPVGNAKAIPLHIKDAHKEGRNIECHRFNRDMYSPFKWGMILTFDKWSMWLAAFDPREYSDIEFANLVEIALMSKIMMDHEHCVRDKMVDKTIEHSPFEIGFGVALQSHYNWKIFVENGEAETDDEAVAAFFKTELWSERLKEIKTHERGYTRQVPGQERSDTYIRDDDE